MDAFKLTVLGAVMVSMVALGVIVLVTQDAITNSTAPDEERGLVTSKSPITDKPKVNYGVSLSDGRTLYIQNDTVLYNSIIENQTYLFDCRINFNDHMLQIQSVNPQGGLVISKVAVNDKPSVHYAVNLANGRTFYIANNATLYGSIVVNQTYLFDCQVDYAHDMLLINRVQLVPESNP